MLMVEAQIRCSRRMRPVQNWPAARHHLRSRRRARDLPPRAVAVGPLARLVPPHHRRRRPAGPVRVGDTGRRRSGRRWMPARRRETAQSARLRGRCASIGRADVAPRATRALYAAVRASIAYPTSFAPDPRVRSYLCASPRSGRSECMRAASSAAGQHGAGIEHWCPGRRGLSEPRAYTRCVRDASRLDRLPTCYSQPDAVATAHHLRP